MRKEDLEDVERIYKRHGRAFCADMLGDLTHQMPGYFPTVPMALLNYPDVKHLHFFATEMINKTLCEMRDLQGEEEVDSKRMTEWRSAMGNVRRIHAILLNNKLAHIAQCKKISTICARELRRGLSKTSKTNPTLKSKRVHKELCLCVKKSERSVKDRTKQAEKAETERRKKEIEEKEELKQRKKFEYLLNQTELFSHFILNKNKGNFAMPENLADMKAEDYDRIRRCEETPGGEGAEEFGEGAWAKETGEDKDEHVKRRQTGLHISQPGILTCELKGYQLKGLSWLVGLYDKGINGILADDMGLGKTIQSIALLAYLFETENIPGLFLVVTPASTLHNWSQEFSRFLPDFKICCFWGSTAERKELKKQFKTSNVVITSYQIAVTDEKTFQKVKWQYMILDEAQAIKSSSSQRWKVLLSFKTRNRLLLTGTPVQNSMQELWALLHFIMPTLFDSLVEFRDWFSKEIEASATLRKAVNEESLQRLHAILKPFMLRRHKSDVIDELSRKTHVDLYCELSNRQKTIYKDITQSCFNMEMENLVMQLKKVCNHPDLFKKLEPSCGLCFGVNDGIGNTVGFGRSKMDIVVPNIVVQDAFEKLIDREKRMFLLSTRFLDADRSTGPDLTMRRRSLGVNYGNFLDGIRDVGAAALNKRCEPMEGVCGEMIRKTERAIRGRIEDLRRWACCTDAVVAVFPRLVSDRIEFPGIQMGGIHFSLDRTVYVPHWIPS